MAARENFFRSKGEETRLVKILLIEDDESILLLSRRTLEMLGYRVTTAIDGQSALDAFDGDEFDLVITDLNLPGHTGLSIIGKIRQKHIDQPIMVMSGGDMKSLEFREKLEKYGKTFTLSKPFDLDQFASAVKKSLKQTQPAKPH